MTKVRPTSKSRTSLERTRSELTSFLRHAGNRITPSYVAFTEEERLVGDAAKNQAAANPSNTIFDIKYVGPLPLFPWRLCSLESEKA